MSAFFPKPKSNNMPLADIADLSEPKPQHTLALDSNQFQQSCHEEKTMFHETGFQTYLIFYLFLIAHLLSCEPDEQMVKPVKRPAKAAMFLLFCSCLPWGAVVPCFPNKCYPVHSEIRCQATVARTKGAPKFALFHGGKVVAFRPGCWPLQQRKKMCIKLVTGFNT